jgi:uncharacterized protein (TIGR03067 family)
MRDFVVAVDIASPAWLNFGGQALCTSDNLLPLTTSHIMKYFLYICLTIAASLTAFAGGSPDDAKAVQGNWKPVKAELAGQPMADAVLKIIRLKLNNGKYEVFVGNEPDRGTCTVDATTQPKSMTITGTEGPNQGKTFPAIYEINGDTFRICYDLSGSKRPTEFKSLPGTKLYLVTYNRKQE